MKKLNKCLCCGNHNLTPVLDMGEQPLANAFRSTKETSEKWPLAINVCTNCWHVQLSVAVDPEILFKNYLYVSGTSQTMKDHARWFASLVNEFVLDNSFRAFSTNPIKVFEIGCNDGTQLDAFSAIGAQTFGIDPAVNIITKKHSAINDFWSSDHIVEVRAFNPDAIYAQNVFAHTLNPLQFLQDIRSSMGSGTLVFIQNSQADMIKNGEFDTIYHEHRSFFSISSMNTLVQSIGLHIIDIIRSPLHGGSDIFVISKNPKNLAKLENFLHIEYSNKIHQLSTYEKYAEKAKKTIKDLSERIDGYKWQKRTVIGLGAPAKGMTVLNWGNLKIDYVLDDSILKQGKYCPGIGVPVVSQNFVKDLDNVVWVPLAWNFFDEMVEKIKPIREGKNDILLKYFPEIQSTFL